NEGFESRGERIVQDPKLGYVLVDRDGGFIRKTDKVGLQAFMAFEADTHGAKGVEIVSFDSTEKGSQGYLHVSDLDIFPDVKGDKVKTPDEIKVQTEKAAAESKAKVEQKAKDDKARKLFGDFLSRGQYVEEVKRKDGVVVGLALYDSKGVKLRDATKDELELFQDFNRLTMGFSLRGEKVVGSVSKGYQLVDKQGQTIRQATAAELTLYVNHKRKTQVEAQSPNADPQAKVYHDQAVTHLIAEMKTDLANGAVVRHKTQAADKIELSNANDPAAKAKETDGKVQYFVKIKPDGSKVTPTDVDISRFQAGKVDGPIILGIEMVDKDGKVIRSDLTTNHLEAFEAWKKQEAQAPIHAALKEAGIKATDEAGKKLQGDLLKLSEEGKISKQDLKTASGEGMSKTKIAELESQLGMSRSQWLAELAKDPAAFKARLHTIEVTRAKAEDVVSKITGGANRAEVKTQILADLKKAGVEISTNTEKAVDSMIDLTLTAQKNGIVGMDKGQLTPGQLAGLMTTLYLNQSPSVRIGGAELTHVPMVVEGTLSFLLTDNPKATASDKRVAFVTALFHDAGKWDPNMRTESGFTVKQHPFFNPTGMDLEIKPGETLDEGLSRLVKEGKLSEENKAKVKIPGYLISVIAHHDSKSVHDAMSNLEAQGVLKKGEGEKVWQAIERHGLISSWILDNSFGGIGVLSHVFNKPEFARYVELYQSINGRLAKGEKIELGVLSTDKELTELRQIFSTKFSPLERAMLLGDHQGQIDVAKYL
ncbi:MAG TPA: hypothetical protein VJP40_01535, partial [bacterium]|nr:hypothetical protein [bacterium]